MTVDNRTPLLNIPLPDIQNPLSDDVARIQSAFTLIDQLISDKASHSELAAAVTEAVADLIDSSPAALDTLNELAAALGDDPNFATTMATQLGLKLDKASYTAADVLAKLLTVHGAGSGLDADKLDGLHASAFATAAQGAKADTAVQPAVLGTAAAKDAPVSGNATLGQVVLGSDTRLSDARTPTAHVHAVATQSVDGFMSTADKTKLDGVATNANNYAHPTGDGNLHVPATGTTNNGKVLKAGSTAGSSAWGSVAYSELTGAPTLGTAAAKNVPATGNAATAEVVLGSDTRLTDSRPASDVSSWAKAATKPTYTATEVGAQSSDADLTAIAALAGSSGLLRKTAANTWELDTKTPDGYIARAVEDAPAGTTPRVLVIRDSEVLSNVLFRISGVLAADTNVYFPDIMRRPIMVENDTSGAYKLTIVSDGPATVEIPTGKKAIIYIQSIGVFLSNTYFGPNAKSDIGLSNVDNTSDANKPISTAAQNALALKADVSWVESQPGKNTVRAATAGVLGGVTYATQTITARTTLSATGTTTSGSASISAVSNAMYYIKVGATISGTGIPAGATVTAVASSTITISANATATGTGVALTITNPLSALVVDGVTLVLNDRILVKDESTSKNGLYTLTTLGTASVPWVLTRTTDGDAWADLVGAQVSVEEGTANAETSWLCTANNGGTLGSTSLPWQLVSNPKLASLGNTTLALGDTIYASSATAYAKLAGNTTTTRKFMRQVGTGTVSAAPVWDTLTLADLPSWQTSIGGIASFSSMGFQIVDNQTSNSTTSVQAGFIGILENSGQSSTWLDNWGFTCNLGGLYGESLCMGSPGQGYGDGFQAINGANVSVLNSTGLHFSNTVDNSSSNTLSWYEPGTFTPVLKGGTTAGTFTYTTQLGRYTRIGRMVYIDVNVTVTGASVAPAGNLYITLPKTAISDANKLSQAAAITNNLTITGQAFVQTQSGSVNAAVLAVNNGTTTAVSASSDTSFTLQFSLAYVAA
jgi:hypothetical protein